MSPTLSSSRRGVRRRGGTRPDEPPPQFFLQQPLAAPPPWEYACVASPKSSPTGAPYTLRRGAHMNARVKKVLETSFSGLAALLILTAFAVASARAQGREEHFISARAGGVNFVSGEVKTRRSGEVGWRQPTHKAAVL